MLSFTPGPLGPAGIQIKKCLHSNVHRLVPAYSFGAAVVGLADRACSITHQLPRFCPGRRCDFSAPVHQILHIQGPVARRQKGQATWPPPKPSEAGSVGREGARKRHDGCPYLGVRNRADFATTMPAGKLPSDFLEGVPRNGGLGVDDCERPLRVGAHRNQPPGHFWFLFGQTKRNPPRRAELFMYHPKNQ